VYVSNNVSEDKYVSAKVQSVPVSLYRQMVVCGTERQLQNHDIENRTNLVLINHLKVC
jgi:hypothetical protein